MPLIPYLKDRAYRVFAPTRLLRETYKAFRRLLEHDHQCHQLLTTLEEFYHDGNRADFNAVLTTYHALSHAVEQMIRHLDAMAPRSYGRLFSVFQDIDSTIRGAGLRMENPDPSPPFSLPLGEGPTGSEALLGGKATNLSKIAAGLHLPAPKGFVITSNAFHYFCEVHRLRPRIEKALSRLDIDSPSSLEEISSELTASILESPLPPDLEKAIHRSWQAAFGEPRDGNWGSRDPGLVRCAVRSSAVGEDAAFSFAGQYQSALHVEAGRLAEAYKQVIASKYSAGAIFYRVKNGLLDQETPMAVLVLEMVDALSSGIVYSRSPVSLGGPSLTIYSIWGLGELLVRGDTVPDIIEFSREAGLDRALRNEAGTQDTKMVITPHGDLETLPLEPGEKGRLSIDDEGARQLAEWALLLEGHFQSPQDMEWCRDREGRLYILQSRPLLMDTPGEEACPIDPPGISNSVLLSGGERAVSGVGAGKVVVAHSYADLIDIPAGSVLVTHTASPGLARVMDRLSAVVADLGSMAGHFASVAREWGVPTLVNTREATRILKPGVLVTVDADHRRIYAGKVEPLSERSCDRGKIPLESHFMERLRLTLDLTSPLHLLNPRDPGFTPEACKSLHDMVRYTHEKAVQEMFSLGGKGMGRVRGAQKLVSHIPLTLYVLDLSGGPRKGVLKGGEIHLEEMKNRGLLALWKGLGRPEIVWSSDAPNFDWQEFDRLSAGIISLDSQLLASFAVTSEDYLNINIRFGYHFVVIDALLSPETGQNYISFQFKGGGATPDRRLLRIRFLERVLREHGFEIRLEGDIIDVSQQGNPLPEIEKKLEMLGFLLGFTRLLDQRLEDEHGVQTAADKFLATYPPT